MKVLLTGGAGFIGSCYLKKLNDMGIDDILVVDTKEDPSVYKTLQGKKFKSYETRESLLMRVQDNKLDPVDVIVHLGACTDTTERDEKYLRENNLEYSQSLCLWAKDNKARFHYASSAAIYGSGDKGYSDSVDEFGKYKALNGYGESKRLFDSWLIKEKLIDSVVGFRYFNVFGPNEYHKGDMRSMVNKAFDQIKESGKVKLFANTREGHTDGSEERDFVYVKDINEAMAFFLENPDKNGIFNLGTGKARSFKDLVSAVFKAMGKKEKIEFIPMPEALKGQYQYFTEADLTHLKNAGYKKSFRSLEDSVTDYVQNHLQKANPYY